MEKEKETGVDPDRRLVLKAGALGALATLAGVLLHRDTDETFEPAPQNPVVTETQEEFQERLLRTFAEPEKSKLPPDMKLIPEWERTGSDILIAISSKNGEIDAALLRRWDSVLRAFPPLTRVHVVTAGKAEKFVESKLRPRHSKLQFSVYPLPLPGFNDDEIFAQDIVFATGSRDSSGRFQLLTSIFDHAIATKEKTRKHRTNFRFNQLVSELLVDENLAKHYPSIFASHSVGALCEGGDMEITRLPNGKSAVVLGTSVMIRMVCSLAALTKFPFEEMFLIVKEYYRKTFKVQEVIVLNPGHIARTCSQIFQRSSSDFSSPPFYHQDMIVRPTVDPKGHYVAFCTTIDPSEETLNQLDEMLLRQARAQFEVLGYEIVELPCGIEPAQNYTNVQMFTPPGQSTHILLPQYGHKFDSVAREKYEQRGYTVIPVDFSGQDPDDFSGSVHCLTEVLA